MPVPGGATPPTPTLPLLPLLVCCAAGTACFSWGDAETVILGSVPAACLDGLDNDGDGTVDVEDRACQGSSDDDELLRTDTWRLGELTCIEAPPCAGFGDEDFLVVLDDTPLYVPQFEVASHDVCPTGWRLVVDSILFQPGRALAATYPVAPSPCP